MLGRGTPEDRRRAWTIVLFLLVCAAAVAGAVYIYTLPSVEDLPKPSPTPIPSAQAVDGALRIAW